MASNCGDCTVKKLVLIILVAVMGWGGTSVYVAMAKGDKDNSQDSRLSVLETREEATQKKLTEIDTKMDKLLKYFMIDPKAPAR